MGKNVSKHLKCVAILPAIDLEVLRFDTVVLQEVGHLAERAVTVEVKRLYERIDKVRCTKLFGSICSRYRSQSSKCSDSTTLT